MGKYRLIPHPDFAMPAVRAIEVRVDRLPDQLRLVYDLVGELTALSLPLEPPPERRGDPLWQHSCFEAFFGLPPSHPAFGHYTEYNFATWGGWAAYGFRSYRAGKGLLTGIDPSVQIAADGFHLRLVATLAGADDLPIRLGLSAVIEDKDGTKSYWALAHPPGAPDFHHPDCFAAELPAPGAA